MPGKRLFLALWPDDRQRNAICDILRDRMHALEGNPVNRRNLHVTLVFIGDFPAEKVPELLLKLADVEVESFSLRFDRLAVWSRPQIACLEAPAVPAELKRLKASLESVLQVFDVLPEARVYRPHITVVRGVRSAATSRLAQPVELQWTGFELVESISVPGGVRYRPLKQ